jgi:hypothetical protein
MLSLWVLLHKRAATSAFADDAAPPPDDGASSPSMPALPDLPPMPDFPPSPQAPPDVAWKPLGGDALRQLHDLSQRYPPHATDTRPQVAPRHHFLPYAHRFAYTMAAYGRLNGSTFSTTDVGLRQHLRFIQGISHQHGKDLGFDPDKEYTTNTRTALSHLGVNPEDEIQQYIVCPSCWSLTPLSELDELNSPACTAQVHIGASSNTRRCGTPVYTQTPGYRSPIKVMPITLTSTALRHLLQDATVVDNLQHWRRESDEIEDPYDEMHHDVIPVSIESVGAEDVLYGVSDGAAWRSHTAYVVREVGRDGIPVEVLRGPHTMRHSNLKYALKLILNMDW